MASPSELTNYFGPIALLIGGLWTLVKYRISKADKSKRDAVKDDGNLRDDQREFIQVLQKENREWRTQVDELRKIIDSCRDEIDKLRRELGIERRAREAAEARYIEMFDRRSRPVDLRRPEPPDEP